MSFVDFRFWIVFLLFLGLYKLVSKSIRAPLCLTFSYFFYASFDYRFLVVIFISTIVDYFCGISIEDGRTFRSKAFLGLSLFVNLGLLFSFKYLAYIGEALNQRFGLELPIYGGIFSWALPIGISFYTFQTLSYTIDRYRGEIGPCRSFIQFANYVSFFPQLLAGPIERAKTLLPQLVEFKDLKISNIYSGVPIVMWGLLKKIYIADNIYPMVKTVFLQPQLNLYEVALASFLVTLVVYCDFSAYSDMARGIAKIIGIEIMVNFRPFIFSQSVSDFWKTWHLSLTSWIRDYVFFPFRRSSIGKVLGTWSLGVPFFLVGIWHGPDIEWIYWGGAAALLFVFSRALRSLSWGKYLQLPVLWTMYIALGLFHEMRFFEASKLLDLDVASLGETLGFLILVSPFLVPLLYIDWFVSRASSDDWYQCFSSKTKIVFWSLCLFGVFIFHSEQSLNFIYFEF